MDVIPISPAAANPKLRQPDTSLQAAATELEAAFLAELLKSAGLGKSRSMLGGGAGEDQFASFLVQEQARQMARSGGIGLSELLVSALMEAQNDPEKPKNQL